MEHPIRKTYLATAFFTLFTFSASPLYSQISTAGKFKGLPADPPELDQHSVPWLPFEEDWNTGLFETNDWTVQQNGNWRIAGQVGNEAPSAEFYYNPAVTNYQKALTSRLLSARNLVDGKIYLTFDLRLTIINPTGMEFLKVQVLSDTTWNTVWAYSNTTSYDWLNLKLDITDSVKGNTFRFRFLAEGQNSLDIYNWMIDNISVYRKCALPLNFEAEIIFPACDEVILEWDPPTGGAGVSAWLAWNYGNNEDAIGLTGGGTFSVAARFTPLQLVDYIGTSLTKLRFFPYAEGNFVLKIWTGSNANNLVLEQPVTIISVGFWNEVILSVPVFVNGDTELWFGYTVTHEAGDSPAGVDAGPAVTGFGDMISLDGSMWESMATAYALNYNWNLEGFVEELNKNHNGSNSYKLIHKIRQSENQKQYTEVDGDFRNRSVLYYNIYKNDVFLDSTSLITYIDPTYVFGYVDCYKVQAVYTDCVSEFTDQDCVMIVDKQKSQPFLCYPVPTDQSLTIKSENELSSLIITNFNFQPVYQAYHLRPGTLTINTTAFTDGIYLIQATDTEGNMITEKFIVSHY